MHNNLNHCSLPDQGLVPIRTVSSLTGVNSVTLRAWERRYDLIKPARTPKGHRLYTMADVDMIHQVVSLLNNGMSIGQVRQVLDNPQAQPGATPEIHIEENPDFWQGYCHRLLQAVAAFDDGVLNDIYSEALSLYPVDMVTHQLIIPLLRELGERWTRGSGSIAEEHFFSLFLRNKLGARFHHLNRNHKGPKLLGACLPGEQHEIGLLLFALAALDQDYSLVLLGPNTPLTELPPVVERAGVHAVVLSGSDETALGVIEEYLPRFCQGVTVPVFVGGRIADGCAGMLADAGAIPLTEDFGLALHQIDAILTPR
ncbi:MAG: MerR family transcriptional regulator [Candidatus Competibacteraceae bacterium]|nr:MerR family transcriptional regulator [Candidatus Competibacteraceae bacterium]